MNKIISIVLSTILISFSQFTFAKDTSMSFFVTSAGPGKGADLGGLKGADAHCQSLATAVSSTKKKWKAYLSTTATNGQAQVNAGDRIGSGPWYNAKGVMIAANLKDLHGGANKLNKENSLSEKGIVIKGRGDKPNQHDILTGTNKDGSASSATCNNWTSSGDGSATVGHHDKKGPADRISWNSAHESFGCDLKSLKMTGGNGYFYCFTVD